MYTRYKSGNNVFSLSGIIFKETPTSNRFSIFFDECTEDKVLTEKSSIEVKPLIVQVNDIACFEYSIIKPLTSNGRGVSSHLIPELVNNGTKIFLLIGFLVDPTYSQLSFNTTVRNSPSNFLFSDLNTNGNLNVGYAQPYFQNKEHANYTLKARYYKGRYLLTKDKNVIHFMNPFEVYNADGTLKNFLFRDDYTPYFLKQTAGAELVDVPISNLEIVD